MASPSLTTLLKQLAAADVDFILVDALAAVTQGAPLTTQDIDIVHERSPTNVDRLLAFLSSVNARYRGRPGPPVAPSRDALLGTGHNLFMTDLGPLDVLGAIEHGKGYEELLPDTVSSQIGHERVRVLSLHALAALKRGSTRNKDKLALLVLEETIRRGGA